MAQNPTSQHKAPSSNDRTVVGKGIRIDGQITGSAPIEVWGTIDGTSGTEGLFWVREGGRVHGEVDAAQVVVEGRVEGKINARQKVELRPTCNVSGDVAAKTVAIAEGAFFEGKISMGGKPKPSK